MSGQGYAFGGKRAQLIRQRMKALRDPEAVKRLFDGKAPADYPDGYVAPDEERSQ